jgi:hypothetical protein
VQRWSAYSRLRSVSKTMTLNGATRSARPASPCLLVALGDAGLGGHLGRSAAAAPPCASSCRSLLERDRAAPLATDRSGSNSRVEAELGRQPLLHGRHLGRSAHEQHIVVRRDAL